MIIYISAVFATQYYIKLYNQDLYLFNNDITKPVTAISGRENGDIFTKAVNESKDRNLDNVAFYLAKNSSDQSTKKDFAGGNYVLDISGSTADLIYYAYHGGGNQLFKLEKTNEGPNSYQIRNEGRCLEFETNKRIFRRENCDETNMNQVYELIDEQALKDTPKKDKEVEIKPKSKSFESVSDARIKKEHYKKPGEAVPTAPPSKLETKKPFKKEEIPKKTEKEPTYTLTKNEIEEICAADEKLPQKNKNGDNTDENPKDTITSFDTDVYPADIEMPGAEKPDSENSSSKNKKNKDPLKIKNKISCPFDDSSARDSDSSSSSKENLDSSIRPGLIKKIKDAIEKCENKKEK